MATEDEQQFKFCMGIINAMLLNPECYSFSRPVDELWERTQLPGYFLVVKTPMDLGTIKKNLESGHYGKADFDVKTFSKDVRQVFQNCFLYNEPKSNLYDLARKVSNSFEQKLKKLPTFTAAPRATSPVSSSSSVDKDDYKHNNNTRSHKSDGGAEASREVWSSTEEGLTSDGNSTEEGKHTRKKEDAKRKENQSESEDSESDDPVTATIVERLEDRVSNLKKLRTKYEGEVQTLKNAEMSNEDLETLRDSVENASWNTIVQILPIFDPYVQAELAKLPMEERPVNPEFVHLELNRVDTIDLRRVEEIVKPETKRIKLVKKIRKYSYEIEAAVARIYNMKKKRSKGISKETRGRRPTSRRVPRNGTM